MTTKKNRRAPRAARPRRQPRANPPPRKGALIEVERRDGAYWFRHPMGHLAGPHRSRAAAMDAGARAFAAALNPSATRAELTELAAALMEEDPARPYARQFADGWRVWDPARRIFLRGPNGAPFATRGEAERRRRELAGEDADDGPMFRRAAPAAAPALDLFAPRPARGGGGAPMQQLGLFGARENPAPPIFHPLTGAGVNEAGRAVYAGLQQIVAEVPGLRLKGRTSKAHGPYQRSHTFDIDAEWIEKNPLLPPEPDLSVVVEVGGVWFFTRDGRARMKGETPVEQAEAALRAVRGWLRHLTRRPNPSALGPLRGLQGEAVIYRPRGDGTVIVRASHAGAGESEREMPLAGALEHRARLLRMGYRANPTAVPATLSFGADAHGTFTVRGKSVRGDVWEYVDVFDAHGTPMGGGTAITAFAPSGVGPLWLLPDDGREAAPVRGGRARGVVYPRARWRDGDPEGGVVEVLASVAPRANGARAALPVGVVRWTWVAPVHLDGALLREMQARGIVYGQPFALARIDEALGEAIVASAAWALSRGATREIDDVGLPGGLAVNDWSDALLTVERIDTRPGGLSGATDTAHLVLDLRPALYRPNPARRPTKPRRATPKRRTPAKPSRRRPAPRTRRR